MEIATAYLPQQVFAPESSGPKLERRVFIAPQRYVQGQNALAEIGRYMSLCRTSRTGVLISEGGRQRDGAKILASLDEAGIAAFVTFFGGECCSEEIRERTAELARENVDCVLAVGGGKCVDTGKAVAYRLNAALVVAPTLASNDAPCSAVSVLYTPDGVSTGVEFYPSNPALVVVDTAVVAAAPERYLVAGMGDAMATWYEARICLENPDAVTTVGARPTLASAAIGQACATALFAHGAAATAAVAAHRVDDALETVVEANTLLSGLGFESGGVAAAHGLAQAYTALPTVHANYLHGEMVAMGTVAQLVMESRDADAVRVAEFFASVGLPVHLGQLSLAPGDSTAIGTVVEATLDFPFIHNMPGEIDAVRIRRAIIDAHELGSAVAGRAGDAAYRRLQATV